MENLHPKNDSNAIYSKKFEGLGFTTRAIHVGQQPEPVHGGVSTSIELSTTHAQTYPGVPYGKYDYSRAGNPTRTSLELQVASLENTKFAQIYSSGMAATSACISLLKVGDEVVCIDDVYGGTQRYFRLISAANQGVTYKFAAIDKPEVLKNSLSEKTKMVWIETPTNPTLRVTDLRESVKIVKSYNKDILIVVDNTFLSPFNCNPIDYGVDIVLNSGSKYLGGHSDIIMGTLCTNCPKLNDKLYFILKCVGAVSSPFDCYLMIRGIKTLSIRMQRINENALAVAEFLTKHKNVSKVCYPGLKTDPNYSIQKTQLREAKGVGFGGVVSFYIKGEKEETCNFLTHLKVWTLAESLGAVESLVNHPAFMTHTSIQPEIRKQLGITDNFVRLSAGIEDVQDLLADLDQALNNMNKQKAKF